MENFNEWFPWVLGLLIVPAVQWLKNTLKLQDLDPRTILLVLAVAGYSVYAWFFEPTLTVAEVKALAANAVATAGTATVAHFAWKKIRPIFNLFIKKG